MHTTIMPAVDRSDSSARLASDRTREYLESSDKTFGNCRQRLISYLVKLNHALDENFIDLSDALLGRFCDSLVDYLSAGHFRVFQRTVPSADEYAAIESSTREAMVFNDAFGNHGDVDLREVKRALERLALTLGTRFELEDDMLRNDRLQDLPVPESGRAQASSESQGIH